MADQEGEDEEIPEVFISHVEIASPEAAKSVPQKSTSEGV